MPDTEHPWTPDHSVTLDALIRTERDSGVLSFLQAARAELRRRQDWPDAVAETVIALRAELARRQELLQAAYQQLREYWSTRQVCACGAEGNARGTPEPHAPGCPTAAAVEGEPSRRSPTLVAG